MDAAEGRQHVDLARRVDPEREDIPNGANCPRSQVGSLTIR
jgi:hypothetical protein